MENLKVIPAEKTRLDQWDDALQESGSASLFQSRIWSDWFRNHMGARVIPLAAVNRKGTWKGLLLITVEGAMSRRFLHKPLIQELFRAFLPQASWIYGPVPFRPKDSVAVHAAFAGYLSNAAWQGMQLSGQTCPNIQEDRIEIRQYQSRGFLTQPWGTYVLDLRKSDDDMLADMKPAARKAIRKANRDRLSVRRANCLSDVKSYWDLIVTVRKERKQAYPPFSHWRDVWTVLHRRGIAEIFLAYQRGTLLSGLGIWRFGNRLYEFGSNQSSESVRNKLYGNDLIKWEVMRWGRDRGAEFYDLMGCPPPGIGTPKEQNIARFKRKFGGRYVPYVILNRPGNSPAHRVVGMVRTIRSHHQ